MLDQTKRKTMSHKGSWNRVKNRKAWDECPLWKNKKEKNHETKHIDTDYSRQGEAASRPTNPHRGTEFRAEEFGAGRASNPE
jgi:hypothetical protein